MNTNIPQRPSSDTATGRSTLSAATGSASHLKTYKNGDWFLAKTLEDLEAGYGLYAKQVGTDLHIQELPSGRVLRSPKSFWQQLYLVLSILWK